MKLVREYINEKFIEDSDPIKDMGIGFFRIRDFEDKKDIHKFIAENIEHIFEIDKLPKAFMVYHKNRGASSIKSTNLEYLEKFITKYITLNGSKINGHNILDSFKLADNLLKLNKGVIIVNKEQWDNDNRYILDEPIVPSKRHPKRKVFEKFSEESDPIHDMGIGIYSKHNFNTAQEALDFMWEILPFLFGRKIPKDIIYNEISGFWHPYHGKIIRDYYEKYLYVENKNVLAYNSKVPMWYFNNALHNALIHAGYSLSDYGKKHYKLKGYDDKPDLRIKNEVKESINEKFIEDSDPIHDMGIGIEGEINRWLKKVFTRNHYTIQNMTEDVKSDFIGVLLRKGKYELIDYMYEYSYIYPNDQCSTYALANLAYDKHWKGCKYLINKGVNLAATIHENPENRLPKTYSRLIELKSMIENEIKESYIGFTEDGDPIQDMGIGLETQMKKKLKNMIVWEFIDFLDEIPKIRKKYRNEDANYDDCYYNDISLKELEKLGIKPYMIQTINNNTNDYDGWIIQDAETVSVGGSD